LAVPQALLFVFFFLRRGAFFFRAGAFVAF
jgi:hypothetical protein